MNRRTTTKPHLLAGLFAALTIAACATGGGISGTSLVFGPIDGFGSIVVNGIAFDTNSAVITLEGNQADVSDLQLGMVVLVRGEINSDGVTGRAKRVATDHLLEGPVDGVNTMDGTFAALSQLVVTDADTVFANATLATLSAGDLVEIFGFRDADDSIRATRVERKPQIDEIELTGTISNLDTTAMTFNIGLLTVDFDGALIEDPLGGGLSNGLLVEVEADEFPVDDVLTAIGIEVVDPSLMAEDGSGLDVEGFVTAVIDADEFVVNGSQRVITTSDTVFSRGTAADIVVNARVDVDGVLDGDGVLIADEVEFVTPITSP